MPLTTILVVEDDQLLRRLLREHLSQAGFRVLEARDGKEALERLQEPLRLALLDIRLPDTDGLTLLKELKRRHPSCEVITMTAHATPEGESEAMRNGAYHYAVKPFALDEIEHLVIGALRTHRMG